MSTKAEAVRAAESKKGLRPKQSRKNAQRKPPHARVSSPAATKKQMEASRQKHDTALTITAEQAASSPEARADRAIAESVRVRGSQVH